MFRCILSWHKHFLWKNIDWSVWQSFVTNHLKCKFFKTLMLLWSYLYDIYSLSWFRFCHLLRFFLYFSKFFFHVKMQQKKKKGNSNFCSKFQNHSIYVWFLKNAKVIDFWFLLFFSPFFSMLFSQGWKKKCVERNKLIMKQWYWFVYLVNFFDKHFVFFFFQNVFYYFLNQNK